MSLYRRIGFLGIVLLVLLRVSIGWHFFMEGSSKIQGGDFTSTGFLSSAQGPLRDQFRSLIPDADGLVRLDRQQMSDLIANYGDRAGSYYRFNDEQKEDVEKIVARQTRMIASIYDQWKDDLMEYQQGFDRLTEMKRDVKWNEVASLHGQQNSIETKWRGLAKPALASIDQIIASLKQQIAEVASPGQRRRGVLAFSYPGEPMLGVRTVDKIIPYFDLVVGILLIVGLFTVPAAVAGGIFLLSVVLTQFPGFPDTQPTYYQAIEAIACLTLAATDAGRFAGLDFILWARKANRLAAA